MATAADRMKTMRDRRRRSDLRELRITVPDPRATSIRDRVARQAATLSQAAEREALQWNEQVSEFDETR